VPIVKGKVEESYRIAASLPTINFLLEKKAQVILLAHIGRPGGKVVKELKIDPVAHVLEKMLKKKVKIIKTDNWSKLEKIEKQISKVKLGTIALCDNVRFAPAEEENKEYFAKELAAFGDIFVIDGFGVVHRSSPSVTGIADYIPSYAGLLLEKEIQGLTQTLEGGKKNSVLIIGGAKIETKLPVIHNLKNKVEVILVGGGIVNTYLKSQGFGVGASLVDEGMLAEAKKLKTIHSIEWPVDVVVGKKDGTDARVVELSKKPGRICDDDEAIFDIGPRTIQLYSEDIKLANTIIWNGAMGYFEQKPYDVATLSIARLVASRSKGAAFGAIGGGETIQAMNATGMEEFVDLVSTGGGAMLEFLSGNKLPGIEIVTKK
ncbi:MAG TPA: phosphoglycerate kinase, partial [Candidatus Magasanikbacteria bacterium]|nr:phosphoglycerate kinase [Candidatus Magasanikbacteria bacterium]